MSTCIRDNSCYIFMFNLFNASSCFVRMYVFVPCVCMVTTAVRSLEMELWMVINHHKGAGNNPTTLVFNKWKIICIKRNVFIRRGHTSLISAPGIQRQVDLCEFEASLIYKSWF